MGMKRIILKSRKAYDVDEADLSKEVEQQLTITTACEVYFLAKNCEQLQSGKGHCRKRQVSIGGWKAEFLIRLIESLPDLPVPYHGDKYELDIVNEEGEEKHLEGPLLEDALSFSYGDTPVPVTKILRRYVPIRSLWGLNSSLSPDYEGKKEIYLFAKEWQNRFLKGEAALHDFEEDFGNACIKLGFQMDCGEECNKQYPELMKNIGEEVHETVESISDLELLGSAVFSYWRYLTHWAWIYDLNSDTCQWFAIVLGRIKDLTQKQ